jgi:hypothetical protein
LSRESYEQALFAVIEHISGMELRNTSKVLIRRYLKDSPEGDAKGRAIDTIVRYLQTDVSAQLRKDDPALRSLMKRLLIESEKTLR